MNKAPHITPDLIVITVAFIKHWTYEQSFSYYTISDCVTTVAFRKHWTHAQSSPYYTKSDCVTTVTFRKQWTYAQSSPFHTRPDCVVTVASMLVFLTLFLDIYFHLFGECTLMHCTPSIFWLCMNKTKSAMTAQAICGKSLKIFGKSLLLWNFVVNLVLCLGLNLSMFIGTV
jgi:hypothetical protein